MEVGDPWAAPASRAVAPPPPPPSPPPPPPPFAPPAAAPALPVLPGGPRPDGGIVPSPVHAGDAPFEPPPSPETGAGTDPDRPVFVPVTRAALGPSRNHRRLRGRAAAAMAGTAVAMAATVLLAGAVLQRRAGAIDLRDGGDMTVARITELDDQVVLATWVAIAALGFAAVLGVVWFRRAYKNLKSMGRNTYGPGWALAGWVVPIMNLFRPYQMAKELVRESPRTRGNEGTGIVGIWWLAYLAGTIGSRGVSNLPTESLDDIILYDMLRVVLLGLSVVSGLAWIAIIRVVTRRQDAWFDPAPEPTPFQSPNDAGDAAHR